MRRTEQPPGGRRGALVGREAELDQLAELLRHAARRGGRIALIEGEAGIGKTRLIEAALEGAAALGYRIFAGAAEELEGRRPFGAIADSLRLERTSPDRRRAAIARLVLGHDRAPTLADAAALGPSAEAEFRASEEILALVEDECARGPVALAVDDLQWADPSSLLVLHRLARRLDALPVALLCVARPLPRRPELERLVGSLAARGTLHLQLGPLAAGAWPDLIEGVAGASPGPNLLRQAAGVLLYGLLASVLAQLWLAGTGAVMLRRAARPTGRSATDSASAR